MVGALIAEELVFLPACYCLAFFFFFSLGSFFLLDDSLFPYGL